MDSMTRLDVPLAAGDVVHAWLRPVARGGTGRILIDATGARHALAVDGPTRNPLPVTWTAEQAGDAVIAWAAAETEVSVIYAFAPASVADTGLRLLWISPATRRDDRLHALHAHPPFGWMNDPNGLCEVDGLTHLFYQHNPHHRRWDTMHWGHAVSRDGVRWVHLPVMIGPREALVRAPDDQGGAFSGTALPRPDGSLRFFYTDRQDARKPAREWQMTAVSADGLSVGPSTVVLDAHPPLPSYRNDWRDPFVFAGPDGRLKMLLGGADRDGSIVLLYDTDDPEGATGWRFLDVLFREAGTRAIPAECPCMIALDGEGAGLWVLIFGLIGSRDEATRRRNLTRTHVGRFDGRRFTSLHEHELDFGTDCYAMQVWQGREGPLGIAWAANWTDVFADRDFESAMTFPRRLIWRDGGLLTPPVAGVEQLRDGVPLALQGVALPLRDGLAEIDLAFEAGTPFSLTLEHPTHEMALVYDGTDIEFRYEPPGNRAVPRYRTRRAGLATARVLIDVGLIEIVLDEGRACCTKRFDSPEPVRAVRLDAPVLRIAQARLWHLRPAADAR